MTVTVLITGKVITLKMSGRLDTETSSQFREEVKQIPANAEKVIFDFTNVTYVSSSGLRELLVCRKQFSGDKMEIINVQENVYEVFEMTGFDSIIPVKVAQDTDATYMTLSFKSFLEKKVQTEGGRVVVKTDTDSYTWEDIEKCSQIVADDLSKLGVKKGTHVGLISANSINWIITFFAIQKLGAMAMLFNFGLFPHETAKVASIGDVTHLCYGEMPAVHDEDAFVDLVKDAEESTVRFVYDIKKNVNLKLRYGEYEAIKYKFGQTIDADTPCTVIFTSGSTGKPKGVILSSYNILNAAVSSRQNQTLNSSDRNCLILPMFHIFGLVAGLFANFLADSLICLPKDIRTDSLLDLIEGERCTIFHSVPTMMIALLNNKNFDPARCATLRCTILSGAAATESQMQMFRKKLPNEHFISSYGLSEMAPVSASNYGDTDEHLLHTVGKPVPNIEIKIQDHVTGKECRIGEQGEILVQGYNLMMGYYKLSPDDQSIDEDGWLHTGDLGYLTEEGYLCLSGRLKELIIRGGENIMPGEVESVLSSLDGVNMVKVFGVPSDFFGEEVGACVKMQEGAVFSEEKIRGELSQKLAKFKIPAYFVVYEDFPLLGSGKIDAVTLKKDMLSKLGRG